MIYNELSKNYNGNVSYSMDIRPLTVQQYLEFNGWKLIEMSFPGDWFGQRGMVTLEDTFGERQDFPVTRHARYKDNNVDCAGYNIANLCCGDLHPTEIVAVLHEEGDEDKQLILYTKYRMCLRKELLRLQLC